MSIARRALYWFTNAAYLAGMPAYAALIRGAAARATSRRQLLDIAKKVRFRGYSLRPYQVDDEILELLDEIERRAPKRVVEIGTARGGTLFLLLQALRKDAHVVSVDLPHGPFGGGYPHWKIPFFQALAFGGPKLTLMRGKSQSKEMRDEVRNALGGPADFLFIDGDHTYEGVKADFELYSELAAPGAMVAFHDIVPHAANEVGVDRFWREVSAGREHRTLVRDWDQGTCGIGLLFL